MDELHTIHEYASDIPEIKTCLGNVELRLENVENKLGIVSISVTKHSEKITELQKKVN